MASDQDRVVRGFPFADALEGVEGEQAPSSEVGRTQEDARMAAQRRVEDAMRTSNFQLRATVLREYLRLDPECAKTMIHFALWHALTHCDDFPGALSALWGGFQVAPEVKDFKTMLTEVSAIADAGGDVTQVFSDTQEHSTKLSEWFSKVMRKLKSTECVSCWDPCVALDVATQDAKGEALILYKSTVSGHLVQDPVQLLRLIFLDVDGVLNTTGQKDMGKVNADLLSNLRGVIANTGAKVILSSTWRNWPELRVLIMAVLPVGSVIGQTRLEDPSCWKNNVRPREIRDCIAHVETEIGPVTSWAAVDDMNLTRQANDLAKHDPTMRGFIPLLESHFVHTCEYVGLDDEKSALLTKILLE